MVKEEWDFSKTFGATIIHVEMDELQEAANTYTEAEADKILEKMKNEGRIGKVETDQGRMRSAAKDSWFDLAHEGSTAHSLAEDVSKVVIQDGGDGTMVGLPYKHPCLKSQ